MEIISCKYVNVFCMQEAESATLEAVSKSKLGSVMSLNLCDFASFTKDINPIHEYCYSNE